METTKEEHLKRSICSTSLGYNYEKEGYVTLMSDIPKLDEIHFALF